MRILVGNLNARTTAQHVANLFVQFGKVVSVRIERAGMAFVEMESKAGMIAIRELDGVNFMNHYLDIAEVAPPSQYAVR
jgi:RNA recognition motif-containing protein